MSNHIGSFLGHYKVLSKLASGAMGEVYLGFDEELQLHVAVKVLSDAISLQPDMIDRFKREARAAARLNHPNVARVFYFNFKGDTPFYAMELIEGVSLADVLERRMRLSVRQFVDIFDQAARGLRAAANRGIVHRDIKPGNLMVGRDGLVKVVDFGLAKVGGEKNLTQTGAMMGTPFYLSPEAVTGDGVDNRSDIYSLGVTMFHLLVGYPPYDAETPYAVMMQHIQSPVPDPRQHNEQLPAPLCELIQRCMAKDPDDRVANWEAFLNALAAARDALGDRLDDPLAFCGNCDVNVVVSADTCTQCRRPLGQGKRPELHDLFLTGFRNQDAERRCVQYIAEAVGRRVDVVRGALRKLPFKIGHRLTFTKAKDMQRRFYELGGEVEMKRVAEDKRDTVSDRLEFVAAAAARTASFVATPEQMAPLRKRARLRPTQIIIAVLGVMVLLLVGMLVRQGFRGDGVPEERPTEVVEPDGGSDGAVEAADGGTSGGTAEAENGTPAHDEGPLIIEGVEAVPAVTVEAVEAALEEALQQLPRTVPWSPATPPRVSLAPDQHFRTAGDPRAWERCMSDPVERFPTGGLEPGDDGLAVAAAHWVSRAAVADLAGVDAPGWLALGVAFDQEARLRPLDPEPFQVLAREESHIPVGFWGASRGRNPPENIARSQTMVEFLVARSGPETFARFLGAVRSGGSVDAALRDTYGASPERLQEDWAGFLTARYATNWD